jgi:hypothetical protein
MNIAVILPSRGLLFSRTAEELLRSLEGYEYDIFFAHKLPIPLCFEKPLTDALRGSYTHIWMVEDDMVLPDGTLDSMLIMDAPVVTMDYPVSKDGQGTVFKDKSGRVVFTGTGCLLIKREVFDELKAPYFRTDIKWGITNHSDFIRFTPKLIPTKEGYGLHDVTFGMKLWKAGVPISVAGNIGQRKLVALGKVGSNNGAHQIEEWHKVKRNFLYKKYRRMDVQPIGKLIPVQTLEGELMVHPDKAKKMYKAGMATKIPKQSVSVDYGDVDL